MHGYLTAGLCDQVSVPTRLLPTIAARRLPARAAGLTRTAKDYASHSDSTKQPTRHVCAALARCSPHVFNYAKKQNGTHAYRRDMPTTFSNTATWAPTGSIEKHSSGGVHERQMGQAPCVQEAAKPNVSSRACFPYSALPRHVLPCVQLVKSEGLRQGHPWARKIRGILYRAFVARLSNIPCITQKSNACALAPRQLRARGEELTKEEARTI